MQTQFQRKEFSSQDGATIARNLKFFVTKLIFSLKIFPAYLQSRLNARHFQTTQFYTCLAMPPCQKLILVSSLLIRASKQFMRSIILDSSQRSFQSFSSCSYYTWYSECCTNISQLALEDLKFCQITIFGAKFGHSPSQDFSTLRMDAE